MAREGQHDARLGVGVHEDFDEGVRRVEAFGELFDQSQGYLGVPRDHRLEGLGLDEEAARGLDDGGGRRARLTVEDSKLAEEVSRPEDRDEFVFAGDVL